MENRRKEEEGTKKKLKEKRKIGERNDPWMYEEEGR